ncbi:hypothetical protein CLF_100267 [Clonorchis sinensis]|uniref:Endonuclease/exonuclease/phosphatase domain-containing protein n=1 Tax=Clonorchis sinensis TaxID=79923 RepID=G7Y2Z9_CLOSI|nr:hypothetical protein CLF_100267 [Clonorchis sinensis]
MQRSDLNYGPSGERQPLNDNNKTDPKNFGESLDPVYQPKVASSMVHNRCGRNGCPSNVRRGMQCHTCKAWWHFKCTGLQDDQVSQLANSPDPFVCASCLYIKGAMHSPTREKAIKNKTNYSLPNHTDQCKCSSLIDVLATKLELLSKALTDANTKNAAIWTKVDKELSSLNEYLALSTPGLLAAKKVIQLSDAAIKTATASLVDRRKILGRAVSVQKANPTIRRLSEDRPLDARKPGHSSSREEMRKKLPDGAISADPKLKAKPIVVIAPCAPESTPRQTTATPDSSFYSTTADPSNSKDNAKGAAVNSKPKPPLNWTCSDERSQAAKPTGKPTTCADVDIGECCENRTSTEATQHVVAPTRYRAGQQPSLLDLVITNERHFVDQVTINAPLGHSDHCVLTFDFICYWARNPEPQTWIRNFCRADFSGMRIFLNQVKLGPASVEDLYRTIVQKVHEADAMYVPKKPARSRTSRKLPKRIRRLLEKRSQLFLKKLTTGDTEDELAFRKMRNRCKSEIRQWNIRKQATILDLARKNRNVLFKYMRHRRRNKPSAFSLRDRNGEPTSDPIVVSEFYRDHYAGDSANSFVMHGEKGPEDITRIDAKKDLGIWLSPNLSFSLHLEKSAQKAFAVLRMIRRTFSRITRTDFQILYGAYVRPLLEYANPVVYSGRTKDVILIERVQRAATKMVAGLKSMDYETRLVVLDLFPLEYRRLRGDLILTYALIEQGLANRFFTVDPANTRRGHGERQLLNDKNKTDPGNLGKSLAPVYQSVNP